MFHQPKSLASGAIASHRHSPPAGVPAACPIPNLSEAEIARLINLYREFSALDTALVLSDATLAPRLDRFTAEHRSKVRPPFRQYAGLLFYTVLTLERDLGDFSGVSGGSLDSVAAVDNGPNRARPGMGRKLPLR